MPSNKVEICGVDTSTLPVIKNERMRELFPRVHAGDTEARAEFIRGNLRLVLSVIQRFNNRGESVDDLFQVGCIGLMKAIDQFRPESERAVFHLCGADDHRRDPPVSAGQQSHPGHPVPCGTPPTEPCGPGRS